MTLVYIVGAMNWVQKLDWDELGLYLNADRKAHTEPSTGQTEAFFKQHGRLQYHWINNAGHAVSSIAYTYM